MQAQLSRRPGVCVFCAFTRRLSPRAPSLHTSAPLWRVPSKRKPTTKPPRERPLPARIALGPLAKSVHPNGPFRTKSLTLEDLGSRDNATFDQVRKIAFARLGSIRKTVLAHPMLKTMEVSLLDARSHWSSFDKLLHQSFPAGSKLEDLDIKDEEMARLGSALMTAYRDRGTKGTDQQLENAFLGRVASTRSFSQDDFRNQRVLADLRYPTEWFPSTRKMQRKIIMHVGPTNSGKTYHALKRLEQAKSGAYAGPLRLLAHEVYTRMNAKGAKCALITGEERRPPPIEGEGRGLVACTVEMIPLREQMEVCVIDEIQMLGDIDRGWAWTQALLGVQAKEIHLCGEARTVPLVRELAATMGDEVEINTYERLTPLKLDDQSVNMEKFQNLRKGDCIVAFSVMEIHSLRKQIQNQTGQKVAIVYGSLPPETRAQQARLFNDPNSGYDVLVASDAIGMGLNLSIKRVIFASITKFNGYEEVPLTVPHLKQIAGRAGRYKTAHEANLEAEKNSKDQSTDIVSATLPADVDFEFAEPPPGGGLVSSLSRKAMPFIKAAMETEPEPLKTAGLFPPDNIVERFANYFPPGTPFSYVLLRLHDISRVHKRFHMCLFKDQLAIADTIQSIEGLTILDRILFVAAPAPVKWPSERQLLHNLAQCVAEQKNGNLLDIEGFNWSVLDRPTTVDRAYLGELEELHKAIVLYLWLSYRFSGVFSTRALAFHAKTLVEQSIEATLEELTRSGQLFKQQRRAKDRALRLDEYKKNLLDALEADEEDPSTKEEERAIPEGSRYEEVDILDGAEEGEAVDPVEVKDETVQYVTEEGSETEAGSESAEERGEEDETEMGGVLADSFGNLDTEGQGNNTNTNTADKP